MFKWLQTVEKLIIAILAVVTVPAFAALPTLDKGAATFAKDGDWLSVLIFNVRELGLILALLVGLTALVGTSYNVVQKFRMCQKGQADWGELMVSVAVAAVIVGIVIFLLTTAVSSINPK